MIDKKYTWDLTKFCKSIEDCENKINELDKELIELETFKGQLGNAEKLYEFLEKLYKFDNKLSTCYVYSHANLDVQFKNQNYQILTQKVKDFANKKSKALAFFKPEIKNLGNSYLESLKSNTKFSDWKMVLDRFIMANDHTLSEVEQKLLSEYTKLGEGFKSVFTNCYFSDIKYKDAVDSNGNTYKLNTGNIGSFSFNPDRQLRKSASDSQKEAYANYGGLMTQNFINWLTYNHTICKLEKYNSVLENYLDYYKLDKKVYENIIEYVTKNSYLKTEYYNIKKQLLNLETMYTYDINAPLENITKKYSFEEAVDIIKKALSVLGEDYIKLIDRAVAERWIDVYPKDDKRNGGYCWGAYSYTCIILLNWTDNLNDVFTLAHELGHAIQHYITNNNQKSQNSDWPVFMAEVASTFNEILLSNYLIKNSTNDNEKFLLLNQQMENIIRTVINQANYSKFEDFCYKTLENGNQLTKEMMEEKWNECCYSSLKDVVNTESANTLAWQNVTHFYNLSYYIWQYSLAYMISSYFANNIINNKENALKIYFEFLRGGNQEYPSDFLTRLGVDINNSNFYEESFKNFEITLKQFEEAFKKYKK